MYLENTGIKIQNTMKKKKKSIIYANMQAQYSLSYLLDDFEKNTYLIIENILQTSSNAYFYLELEKF